MKLFTFNLFALFFLVSCQSSDLVNPHSTQQIGLLGSRGVMIIGMDYVPKNVVDRDLKRNILYVVLQRTEGGYVWAGEQGKAIIRKTGSKVSKEIRQGCIYFDEGGVLMEKKFSKKVSASDFEALLDTINFDTSIPELAKNIKTGIDSL